MAVASRKILVVDDDPWIAKMLEFVCSDAGHVAVVCKDGNDALDKSRAAAAANMAQLTSGLGLPPGLL